jgi:hypothetical protein
MFWDNGCADSVAKPVVVDSCVSNIYEYNLEKKNWSYYWSKWKRNKKQKKY